MTTASGFTGLADIGSDGTVRLAAIQFGRDEDVDHILEGVVQELRRREVKLRGLLPRHETMPRSAHPVMYVDNIADGQRFQISQDLGPEATGCRLDPDGLARAAAAVAASLSPETEFLILNRFGRAEAEGGGLRDVIEQAIATGVPVLVAVRDNYVPAWNDFHGGLAESLPRDVAAVLRWCLDATGSPSSAVGDT